MQGFFIAIVGIGGGAGSLGIYSCTLAMRGDLVICVVQPRRNPQGNIGSAREK